MTVVLCTTAVTTAADGSQELVGEDHRVSDPDAVSRLAAALRRPDAPPYQGACSAVGYLQPWLYLLDARGHWLRPTLPAAACGGPQTAVGDALAAISRRPATAWPIREIVSAAAARSGCTEQWADMVHVETSVFHDARAAASTTDPFPRGGAVRACDYRVPASEQHSDKPAGTFERGAVLTTAQRSRLGGLLSTAGPAAACTAEASRFGLLLPAGGRGPTVYVEVDGCRRILTETLVGSRQTEQLSQVSPGLVELLDSVG